MTLHLLFRRLAVCLLLPLSAMAQSLTCPAPATLVQVASCLPPVELRAAYIGYCSDNRRMYSADTETCTSFESYVRARHTALWESPDGAFQGYLSCELAAASVAAMPPATLSITRQGAVTRVACRYGEAATLAHRTRARCTLSEACATDPSGCKARCD